MARVLFKRAAPGTMTVRGELVRRLQLGLQAKGADPGKIDGIYGGDSETAVKAWQGGAGAPATGAVTFEDWTAITERAAPTIKERALQLTATFEGHGFGKVAGNFDGAWLTWGIIGFTLKHGEVQKIVNEVRSRHRPLLQRAFGLLELALLDAIDGSAAEQEAFGNRISLPPRRYKVRPEWAKAFDTFGGFEEVQEIQLERVDTYWERAVADARRFDLKSEMGVALCFDIAVQNGGIDDDQEENSIRRRLAQNPPADEKARRLIIADVVAENSRPEYIEDVRSRKRTIASGSGAVHGARFALADWGIDETPWA